MKFVTAKSYTFALPLLLLLIFALASSVSAQDYPEMTIEQIQSNLEDGTDVSIFAGDTVWVRGVVTSRSGLFYAGSHITYYLQDPNFDMYGGILIYGEEEATADPVFEGDSIRVLGEVYEYYSSDYGINMTEIDLVDGSFNTELIGTTTVPDPIELSCADIDTSQGLIYGEPYEGMLVQLNDLTYVGTNSFGNWRLNCNDGNGTIWVRLASDSLGTFTLDEGTQIESITGVVYHRFGAYFVQPRYDYDIVLAGTAPLISDVEFLPSFPTPADDVDVSAVMIDPNGEIETAELTYRIDGGSWMTLPMTEGVNDEYSATISAQADGAVVDFYVYAADNDGEEAWNPANAPDEYHSYTVAQPTQTTVAGIQETDDPGDDGTYPSPLLGDLVTVEGVVTSDHLDGLSYGFYLYGDAGTREGEWMSIFVYDDGGYDPVIGDRVEVTGLVLEYNGVTELSIAVSDAPNADYTVLNSGESVAPFAMSTAELQYDDGAITEPFEGAWVQLNDVTVTDVTNYDFLVEDGSGGEARISLGNMISDYEPEVGNDIPRVEGYMHFSFGTYQLYLADIIMEVGIEDDIEALPNQVMLHQNFPNPFNPSTAIGFSLPIKADVSLKIYNTTGQLVKTLGDRSFEAGHHTLTWDGTNQGGEAVSSGIYFYRLKTDGFTNSKRMILMK